MFGRTCRLFSFMFLSGLLLAATTTASMRSISAVEAQTLMKQTPAIYLLDVRTLDEYVQKRIAGAHLIPIDQIQSRLREIPRDQPIIVYCAVGARSEQVANYLARLGYAQVYNMFGGIMSWQVRGYPIQTGRP